MTHARFVESVPELTASPLSPVHYEVNHAVTDALSLFSTLSHPVPRLCHVGR
jgi:hypothetical protein